MDKDINLHGKKYISARRASEITGYTSDYVGQLCRAKKIDSKLIGRSWYVLKKDILKHKNSNTKSSEEISRKPLFVSSKDFGKKKKTVNKTRSKILEPVVFRSGLNTKKIAYIKDDSPLFPVISRKFDYESTKYIALESVEKSLNKPRRSPFVEKFAINTAVVSFALLFVFVYVFGEEKISKLMPYKFLENAGQEISLLYGPYMNDVRASFNKFEQNISSVNQSGGQLASAIFSANTWNSVAGWVKDTAYKIVKPWLKDDVVLTTSSNPLNPPYIKGETGRAITMNIVGASKDYVDSQISELKKYFLTLPFTSSIAPNVNRYYITNQNDRIVDLINQSSGTSSGGGTSNVANLSDLSDLTLTSTTYGDVLIYDGSKWVNTATSTLGITGTGASFGQAWEVNADGYLAPTTTITTLFGDGFLSTASSTIVGNATTTGSMGVGALYINNDYITDLVGSGLSLTGGVLSSTGGTGNVSTSTVPNIGELAYWTGDGTPSTLGSIATGTITCIGTSSCGAGSYVIGGDLTITGSGLASYDAWTHPSYGGSATTSILTISGGFLSTASSTVSGDFRLSSIGEGFTYTGSGGKLNSIASSSVNLSWFNNDSGFKTFAWPFDAYPWGVGTTTTLGLLGGVFTNASSTITELHTGLTDGFAYIGSGLLRSVASSSINLSELNNDAGFLTSATGLTSYDAFTHPLSGYSATTSSLVIGASSSPYALLSVSNYSTGANTTPLFVVASSTGTSATSTAFIINSLGNVGIGTTNPTQALDVNGNVKASYFFGNLQGNNWFYNGSSPANSFIQVNSGYALDVNHVFYVLSGGNVGIGTTTPQYKLNSYSTTASQLALSAGAGVAQWAFRNAGGNLYFATTTIDGTATTSISALEIDGTTGTTTVRGLNISGQATTTSNVGINLSAGCFATG
ncbi:MAG: hypothetical protein V1896_01145, partial [Candidatus Zambryskibacteria bacterium]